MKVRSALACLFASAAAVAVTAMPAQAAGPEAISKCSDNHSYGYGTIITRDSYLTKDLTCQKGFGIGNGATLDLRGHTLTGKPDPYSCVGQGCPDDGVHDQPGHAAIVLGEGQVKNGRLKDWDFGVRVFSGQEGARRSMTKLTVTDMAVAGVFAMDNTDSVYISWSLFTRNPVGAETSYGGGFKIDHSAFVGNGAGAVVQAGTELTATDSAFTGNVNDGLSQTFGTAPGTIARNVFAGNGGDGVFVGASDGGVRVGNNVALKNGGHGMSFGTGDGIGVVTDLGGNRASGNRTAPQCIGVVCR